MRQTTLGEINVIKLVIGHYAVTLLQPAEGVKLLTIDAKHGQTVEVIVRDVNKPDDRGVCENVTRKFDAFGGSDVKGIDLPELFNRIIRQNAIDWEGEHR